MDFVHPLSPGDGRNVFPSRSLFEVFLSAGRKTEFEWKGINRIRPSPELGMPEIQSRFPVAVWSGNLIETKGSHKYFCTTV